MTVNYKVDMGCNGNKEHSIYSNNYFLASQKMYWQQQKINHT